MHLRKVIAVLALFSLPGVSQDIAVTGTIKDTDGKIIENALLRFEKMGYVAVSSSDGKFVLTNSSPVQQIRPVVAGGAAVIKKGILHFSVENRERVGFSVFTLQGVKCAEQEFSGLQSGSYAVSLKTAVPSRLGSGTYIVAVSIGRTRLAEKVIHRSGASGTLQLTPELTYGQASLLARQTDILDVVTISKLGYVTQSIQIESYQQNLGEIILVKSSELGTAAAIQTVEDSLVKLLIERVQSIEELEGPDELKTIDFISLRNGFEAILAIDANRPKSNIGYMLTAIASLNTNPKIWKIADSLDAYFDALNSESDNGGTGKKLMKRAMQKGGVFTLGKALAAKTPAMLMAAAQKPSFPKFLTVSYIQDLIEQDLIPVVVAVSQAAERVEALSDATVPITVDGDEFEIDKGEVYAFDAYMRLVQASMFMFCTYDMDLYTSADRMDYSWVDTMVGIDNEYRTIYTLSNDTLFRIDSWGDDKKEMMTMMGMLHYNIEERTSFMTIKRPYHSAVFDNLKAIPAKIKAGLAAIKAETDDQENDLLKISMIDSANAEMLDFSGEMRDEGFSASFAENFSSIDKLMDFVNSLLSGPYTFDDVVDGKQVTITVNLPAYYSNPVADLRDLLPHYTWTSETEWAKLDTSMWGGQYYSRRTVYNQAESRYDTLYYINVYEYNETEVRIADNLIDSVVTSEWGDKKYYINHPIHYSVNIDSTYYFDGLRLTDENNQIISNEQIEELIDNKMFFPYFDDYTFNGLFPDMTRAKWLDLIWSE